MKNINKLLIAFVGVIAMSCTGDDVENRPIITKGTEPVLLSPKSDFNLILMKSEENKLATTLVWQKALYEGNATEIKYSIEIAQKGTNFAKPYSLSTTTNIYKDLTIGELNSGLINAGFKPLVESEVEFRINSTVGGVGSISQLSKSITLKLTPYKVPLASSHWLVGAATPGGWTWDDDAETEFPLVIGKTNIYQVSIVLKSGEAFRKFLGNNFTSNGNWDASRNYTYYSSNGWTIDSELVDAKDDDNNFKYTGPTGERVLTFDYDKKEISLD